MNNIPTLESLSFKTVFKNFSRYALECQTTRDDKFTKNMYFLQLRYSKTLLYQLHKKKIIEKLHLDFLLNEHLQELDIALVLSYLNKDEIIKKLIPISPSIRELSCSEKCNRDDCLDILTAIIPHAVNVQRIIIPFTCNNELLKAIASYCLHLTKLNIRGSSLVTYQGLKALCVDTKIPSQGATCKLTYLDLSDVGITCDDIIMILKDIPTLEEVYFDDLPSALYSIHKVDIDNNVLSCAKKYNLKTLDFSKYYFDSSLLLTLLTMCAELCPLVKKLVIPISEQYILDACHIYSHLESFTLDSNVYYVDHRNNLNNFLQLKGKTLKHLSVNHCILSVSNLIDNCPKLESLQLRDIEDEQMSRKYSKSLNNLKELKLETMVDDSIIALLNASPNVKTLYLYNLYNGEFEESALLGNLSKFTFSMSLKHLFIENSDHLDVHLVQQIILSCNSLEFLSLNSWENISSSDINSLNEFVKVSNREIEIYCSDEHLSDYSNHDYESGNDNEYAIYSDSDDSIQCIDIDYAFI